MPTAFWSGHRHHRSHSTALKRVTGVDRRGDNLDNQAQMATLSVGRYPGIPVPPSLRSTSDKGKHWPQPHWRSHLSQSPSLSPSSLAPVDLEAICYMSRIIQIQAPYLCLLQVQVRSKEIGACGPQRSSVMLLQEQSRRSTNSMTNEKCLAREQRDVDLVRGDGKGD